VVPVPSSESEWLKLQKQTAGSVTGTAPPAPTYDFNEPLDFNPPQPGSPPPAFAPTQAPIPQQP
jgi:hypothetical protein